MEVCISTLTQIISFQESDLFQLWFFNIKLCVPKQFSFSPTDLLVAMLCSVEVCPFANTSDSDFISLHISKSISKSFLCQIQDYYIEQNTSFLKNCKKQLPSFNMDFLLLMEMKKEEGLVAYSTRRHKI